MKDTGDCRKLPYHPVIVRADPSGAYTAQPIGMPELIVTAGSAEQAIANVRDLLSQSNTTVYWVPISNNGITDTPLDLAGHAKDDPDFDVYLDEIRRFREAADERECSNTSSTPTT